MPRGGSGRPVSCLIGEAPAYDAPERFDAAVATVEAVDGTEAVTEIVLRQTPVKVLLRAMQIDTAHAPLEDAEIAFDGVGVDVVADVLTRRQHLDLVVPR